MKCVTYNIQYGKGRDNKIDLDRIADEVDGADVIALQEVDRRWPRTGNVDQAKYFQERFQSHFSVYGPGVDMHVHGSSPRDSLRRQFGNMILSKFPIETSRNHLLPKHGSIHALSLQRCALEAAIVVGGRPLRIYSLHLSHIASRVRIDELSHILHIHHHAAHEGHQVGGDIAGMDWESGATNRVVAEHAIMMGDFNCRPDSDEYLEIAGPVSDYGGHITGPAGFVDAWCQCGHDKLSGCTSDVKGTPARLDYVFVSAALRDTIVDCRVDTSASGSDHFPVWTEFSF